MRTYLLTFILRTNGSDKAYYAEGGFTTDGMATREQIEKCRAMVLESSTQGMTLAARKTVVATLINSIELAA